MYRHMVAHTLKSLRRLRAHAKVFVFYAPAEAAKKMKGWLGRGHRYIPQSTGSLGDRMLDAFWFASLEGHGATLIVGTDCPDLRPAQLEQAFSALENHDVVLGPTHDGGYFLIGTTQPQPALFHGIAWSTPSVFSSCCRRLLVSCRDRDEAEGATTRRTRSRAPRTPFIIVGHSTR